MLPKVTDEVQSELMVEIDNYVERDPSSKESAEAFRKKANTVFAAHRETPSPRTWYESFRLHETGEAEMGLLSMNWVFLHSSDRQFLTSDNPVFFFAHEGIGNPQSELTFPISSTVALWATRLPYSPNIHIRASPSGVKQINRRTASNHDRFVFSKVDETWIKPFTLKGEWELSRLR